MEPVDSLEQLSLKRKISELEKRLVNPEHWTVGELEIAKQQLANAKSLLKK